MLWKCCMKFTNNTTPLDIEVIRKRLEAATPGPWEYRRWNDESHIVEINDITGWRKDYPECYIAKIGGWGYSGKYANAEFIAYAPTDIAALLTECDKLKNENDKLRENYADHMVVYEALLDEQKKSEALEGEVERLTVNWNKWNVAEAEEKIIVLESKLSRAKAALHKLNSHKAIGQVSDYDFILQMRNMVREAIAELERE